MVDFLQLLVFLQLIEKVEPLIEKNFNFWQILASLCHDSLSIKTKNHEQIFLGQKIRPYGRLLL